ncbi:MAG: hypothetical protein NTY37_06985 [Methanothrix sp.]|nr:hypothetical protein [Methanothrix sp.]
MSHFSAVPAPGTLCGCPTTSTSCPEAHFRRAASTCPQICEAIIRRAIPT